VTSHHNVQLYSTGDILQKYQVSSGSTRRHEQGESRKHECDEPVDNDPARTGYTATKVLVPESNRIKKVI